MRTLSVLLLSAALAHAAPSPAQWARYLLPLPKELKFEGSVTVPLTAVAIRTQGTADLMAPAADLLKQVLACEPAGKPRFTITLALCDASGRVGGSTVREAARLPKLKNSDQAYAIIPQRNALLLTALTDRGLYYAALTLSQLLQPTRTADAVTIPLVRIVDWPDLAERGLWGGNSTSDSAWMSSVKMNLVESHFGVSLTADGHVRAQGNPELFEQAYRRAFKIVPIVTHLDQLGPIGLYEKFPDARGKGPKAPLQGHDYVVAPCASSPDLQRFLVEWMTEYARWPHVNEVCLWLSESALACGCADCQKLGQFRAETRAAVTAWREARKVNPNLKLRILLTQGSYATNADVLDEAPPEVNISYYDGGRTYDSSRDPMIYPLLADFAAKGRWLGVYPQLTASWRIVCPWSGPQFIRTRMTEFVDKGLSNLCGYATPHNRLYDFNVTAAAEWSWNAHGRDEREFALAWATRRGVKDPDKAADRAVMLGPVGWDIYGSRIPYTAFFGEAARMIKDRSKPSLGKGMFRYFPDEKHLADDLAVCSRATALATQIGDPWIIAETQVITGYMTMLSKLHAMATLISAATPPTDTQRLGLARDLDEFARAGMAVSKGLRAWEAASLGTSGGGGRLGDTIAVGEQTVADVSAHLLPFGVRNRWAAYNTRLLGRYVDDDFEVKQAITKRFEVTDGVRGPGLYLVQFAHESGYNGASTHRVALACAPQGQPDQLTEIFADKHAGTIGWTPTGETYSLQLPAYDENLSYFILADLSGPKSSVLPANRRGCQGTVRMWKVLPPGEEPPLLPLLPMSQAEIKRFGGPKFTTGGTRVGVLLGGYGSEGLLKHLQSVAGVDAQPLGTVSTENLKNCQVLIITQPYQRETFSPQMAAAVTAFLKNGGGVLALHDAVGFRGFPVLAPEVCRGGTAKVRDDNWQAALEHPLTAGLPLHKPLKQSYYDYIAVEPGPAGQIVATGSDERLPAIVCGEVGKGRFVACGLGMSIAATSDADVPPTPDEAVLLRNALRWCAGQ